MARRVFDDIAALPSLPTMPVRRARSDGEATVPLRVRRALPVPNIAPLPDSPSLPSVPKLLRSISEAGRRGLLTVAEKGRLKDQLLTGNRVEVSAVVA